jgi:hypothetical protein
MALRPMAEANNSARRLIVFRSPVCQKIRSMASKAGSPSVRHGSMATKPRRLPPSRMLTGVKSPWRKTVRDGSSASRRAQPPSPVEQFVRDQWPPGSGRSGALAPWRQIGRRLGPRPTERPGRVRPAARPLKPPNAVKAHEPALVPHSVPAMRDAEVHKRTPRFWVGWRQLSVPSERRRPEDLDSTVLRCRRLDSGEVD